MKRLRKATEEAQDMDKYDYIVVNDDLEECISTVNSVIKSYRCRRVYQQDYIKSINQELADIK
jgi:guanylate kinase